jgi:hypothetical protein
MLGVAAVIIIRTLLGLLFLTAAIDGLAYVLFKKEPFDPPLTEAGKSFLKTLKNNSLLWAAKAATDLVAALMFLFNFHAPLALLLILPSSVVIVLFQVSINRVGIPVALMLIVLMAAMGGHYASLYAPLLSLADGAGPLASGAYGHPR